MTVSFKDIFNLFPKKAQSKKIILKKEYLLDMKFGKRIFLKIK